MRHATEIPLHGHAFVEVGSQVGRDTTAARPAPWSRVYRERGRDAPRISLGNRV